MNGEGTKMNKIMMQIILCAWKHRKNARLSLFIEKRFSDDAIEYI